MSFFRYILPRLSIFSWISLHLMYMAYIVLLRLPKNQGSAKCIYDVFYPNPIHFKATPLTLAGDVKRGHVMEKENVDKKCSDSVSG